MTTIVYARETYALDGRPSIFLAGPTKRICQSCGGCPNCVGPGAKEPSWRVEAVEHLKRTFDGFVFVPESYDEHAFDERRDWQAQVDWERAALDTATVIMFWIPRNMLTLPGMTTNVEFGWYACARPKALIIGFPLQAPHTRYLRDIAARINRPIYSRLDRTIEAAIAQARYIR